MAETIFDRAERGLGSTDLSIPDIVAQTKGNPQDIMKLVMSGQINVTQGLLAKRLSDSVVAERNAMAAQQPNVLQEQFPELAQATGGLGGMPQAAPPMPAQMGPQMPPQGMPPAQGGIGGLDFAPAQMASGGIVGYQAGGTTAAPQEVMGIPAELFARLNPALNLEAAGAQLQGALPTKSEAMEKLKARLEAGFDPEKERKRAEMSGLVAALGSVKPGMSPMEALVSGFVGSGEKIQESKKEMEAKEMELLKASAEIEDSQNRTAREIYGLQLQLAEAERRGASEVVKAELEVRLADAKQKFDAQEAEQDRINARTVARIQSAGRGGGGGGRLELSAGERGELAKERTRLQGLITTAQDDLTKELAKGTGNWIYADTDPKLVNEYRAQIASAQSELSELNRMLGYTTSAGATGTIGTTGNRVVEYKVLMGNALKQ